MGQQKPTEPGWYDDPHSSKGQMYWNGTKWTGETRPHWEQARRQARNAGWILAAVATVTLIGAGLNSGNWTGQAVFILFGGSATVAALIIYSRLSSRADRIEQDSSGEDGVTETRRP